MEEKNPGWIRSSVKFPEGVIWQAISFDSVDVFYQVQS